MKLAAVAASIALSLAPFSAALADNVSKDEIAKILSEQGYSVQDYDATKVYVDVAQYRIVVAVDGSDGDVSFLVWPGIRANEVGYQFLNKFNNEVKFGRAYIDRDGDVAIQMDRNSAGGVSSANIESDFDVFLLLIQKFLTDLESQSIA